VLAKSVMEGAPERWGRRVFTKKYHAKWFDTDDPSVATWEYLHGDRWTTPNTGGLPGLDVTAPLRKPPKYEVILPKIVEMAEAWSGIDLISRALGVGVKDRSGLRLRQPGRSRCGRPRGRRSTSSSTSTSKAGSRIGRSSSSPSQRTSNGSCGHTSPVASSASGSAGHVVLRAARVLLWPHG
jgi:hypothetical protein